MTDIEYSIELMENVISCMFSDEILPENKDTAAKVAELTKSTIIPALREKAEREKGCDGWISVKDGLPEIGQRVLTCVQGQPWDAKQYFVSLHEYGSTKKWANEYEWRYVTHWMPLPDLPQEATDGHVAE